MATPADSPGAGRRRPSCPAWCVTGHHLHAGEEDWVHTSEPLPVDRGVAARLCMSIDPDTGAIDGPHLLIGSTEYSLPAATTLGAALLELAATGQAEQHRQA